MHNRFIQWLATTMVVAVVSPVLAVPAGLPYSGELSEPSGEPFTGMVDIEARLFAQEVGGDALWGPTVFVGVEVVDGSFTIVLDDASSPIADALEGVDEIWLGFSLKPQGESSWFPLESRQQLLSVPFAHEAGNAAMLGGVSASEFMTATEMEADYAKKTNLAAVATSGAYTDLSNKPDLSGYALTSSLAGVCFSGNYADLVDEPDISVFVTADTLAMVATTGSYADLGSTPDLSLYALLSSLAPVATTGQYNDLGGRPDLSVYAVKDALAAVATSGAYDDLVGAPAAETLLDGVLKADGSVPLTGPWDLGGQLLSGITVAPSDAPVAELEGALWFDTNTAKLRVYDGTEWDELGLADVVVAADIACGGCVDASDLSFSLATVATTGKFSDLVDLPDGLGDGDDDALKELGPTCVAAGDVAKWNGSGWECAPDEGVRTAELEAAIETGVADGLAASGPEAVTGGLLTNKFSTTYSATDTPVAVSGYSPIYSESVIEVPDLGTATSFTVTVNIEHPDATALEVHLLPPVGVGAEVALHQLGTGTSGGLAGTYPTELQTTSGGFDGLVGKNLTGTWTLKVRDNVGPPVDDDGTVVSWSVGFDYTAHSKLEVVGDLFVGGAMTVNGKDVASELASLREELDAMRPLVADKWCELACPDTEYSDVCRETVCDGLAWTCAPGLAMPDGSRCSGSGICQSGECRSCPTPGDNELNLWITVPPGTPQQDGSVHYRPYPPSNLESIEFTTPACITLPVVLPGSPNGGVCHSVVTVGGVFQDGLLVATKFDGVVDCDAPGYFPATSLVFEANGVAVSSIVQASCNGCCSDQRVYLSPDALGLICP